MERNILKENQPQESHSLSYSSPHKHPSPASPEPHPPPPSLALDQQHSLGLLGRSSIDRAIPIPRAMLSHDDQADEPPGEESEREQPPPPQDSESEELYFQHKVKMEEAVEASQAMFVEQLGLNDLLALRRPPNNTKNVLRNFGNAQTQFILYHEDAKAFIKDSLTHPERFVRWVRGHKLEKFDDFKQVWGSAPNTAFGRVYRELCYKFYCEQAVPYVLSSRMKQADTKMSHLRYVYRFLEGLKHPQEFSYFRRAQK